MVLSSTESRTTERKELESFLDYIKTLLPGEKYQCLFEEMAVQYSRVEPLLIKRGTDKNFIALINEHREKVENGKEGPNKAVFKVKQALDKEQKSERENLVSNNGITTKTNSEAVYNNITDPEGTANLNKNSETNSAQASKPQTSESISSAAESACSSLNQLLRDQGAQKLNDPTEALKDAEQLKTTSPSKRKLFAAAETQNEDRSPKAKLAKTVHNDDQPVKSAAPQTIPVDEPKTGSSVQDTAPGPSTCQNDQLLAIGGDEDYSKYDEKLIVHIFKLERYLNKLKKEIDVLERKEMDLNEMEGSCSTYMLIEQYKKKGYEIYQKLQQLKKKPSTLHRKQYKMIKYTKSQYSVLNNMITSLINKDINAPDFVEVLDTVKKFNDQHFKFLNVQSAAQKIFREVVILFKKRRCCDLKDVFTNPQIDLMQLKNDPANSNKDLQSKLKENKLLCKDEKEILQQFTEASELAVKLCNVDAQKTPKSLIEEKFPNATSILVKDKCYLCFDNKTQLEECLSSAKEKPVEIAGTNVEMERVHLAGTQIGEESNDDISSEDDADQECSEVEAKYETEVDSNKIEVEEPVAKVENDEFLSDIEDNTGGSDVELDIFGFPLRSCTKTVNETSAKEGELSETVGKSVTFEEKKSIGDTKKSMSQVSATAPTETSSVTATSDKIEKGHSTTEGSQLDSQSASTISKSNRIEIGKDVEKGNSSSSGNACVLLDDDDEDIICLDD